MGLYIRMALYFVCASLAGQGWIEWDPVEKIVSFDVDDLVPLASGVAGFVATFFAGRVAKKHGGAT